jgi:putative flippase GtrA
MRISRQLLWFCVVGAIGFVADATTLVVARDWLGVYGARVLSFLVAVTVTWLLNRQFTFKGREAGVGILGEYARYFGLMAAGGIVNYATYSLLAWQFDQGPLALVLYVGAGSIAGLLVNYLGASRLLYRRRQHS